MLLPSGRDVGDRAAYGAREGEEANAARATETPINAEARAQECAKGSADAPRRGATSGNRGPERDPLSAL